jgi:hypothetical protein
MGKGSRRRPATVPKARYEENYTRTFGTAVHQNPPHPESVTGSTATQAVEFRITHRSNDADGR